MTDHEDGSADTDPDASSMVQRVALPLLLCVTIGAAPFAPEPHVVGKLRWVAGGAVGMTPVDWFDLFVHGMPWLWLLWTVVAQVMTRVRAT